MRVCISAGLGADNWAGLDWADILLRYRLTNACSFLSVGVAAAASDRGAASELLHETVIGTWTRMFKTRPLDQRATPRALCPPALTWASRPMIDVAVSSVVESPGCLHAPRDFFGGSAP